MTSLALPGEALARNKRPTAVELAHEGIDDPRLRKLPRRHRFRLALMTDYVRATKACNADGSRCTRFHYAPLLLDFAYQLQFLRYAMVRPSLGLGGNVGNNRNAVPVAIQPAIHAGYQGSFVGAAIGYSYIFAFPANPNATGLLSDVGQPVLQNNHVIAGEVSVTSKIDRGALNFGLRVGGMRTHLIHFDLDQVRWFTVVTATVGWFFGPRKRKSRGLPATR